LEDQARELRKLLEAPIPGRSESLVDLRELEHARARVTDGTVLGGPGYDLRTALEALETAQQGVLADLKTMASPERSKRTAMGPPELFVLAWAAALTAAWIRTHHRDRGGRLDGKCCWPDVAEALRRWGYDLSRYADDPDNDPGNGLRKLVERFWVR